MCILLEITTHPHNKKAKIGSSITLTCISPLSNVEFLWTHNGTNIRQQLPINSDTSRLTINNAMYNNGGSYVCIVKSGSLLVVRSDTATITIYGKLYYTSTIIYLVIIAFCRS